MERLVSFTAAPGVELTLADMARVPGTDPATGQPGIPLRTRPVLEVSGLDVWVAGSHQDIRLLESISLNIQEGEFFALVGESGSGKSLLCSTLMGILPTNLSARGDIYFDGGPLATVDRRSRAMIFQQPSRYLNPVRTIGFQLTETIRIVSRGSKREAGERAISLLEAVGIEDPRSTIKKYPHELSGGMNQRVMIALALARRPRLLIADEPTSALDVTTQRQIMDLIEQLRADWNMAVLFVTHDLDLAMERSDRIGVIYAGQLIEMGATEAIARQPLHPYTRSLFSAVPEISLTKINLVALAGGVPDPAIRGAGCHFAPRCAHAVEACARKPEFPTGLSHAAACHNLGLDHAAS